MENMQKVDAKEVQKMKNDLVDRKAYELIREGYLLPENAPFITDHLHRLITGEAARLLWSIMRSNGGYEDLASAAYYLCICEDTLKHHLDHTRYRQIHRIEQLAEKYGVHLTSWKKAS